MRQAAVLALDLATTTGWAWHRPGMPRPYFGAERLPGAAHEVGRPCARLEEFLRDIQIMTKAEGGISHFFFEAQHLSAKINIDTVYKLIALGGIVEKFAFQIGAHAYKVNIAEWRQHFIGRGSAFASRGLNPKEMAIQRCAQYGWHTDQPDAAEALGILDFSLTTIRGYARPWRDNALMGGTRA